MEKILTEMILGSLTLVFMVLIFTYAPDVFLVLALCLVSWCIGYVIADVYRDCREYKNKN